MATKAEIRDKVARKLGIKKASQALSNRFVEDLDEAYNDIHANLERLGLVEWDAAGDVPGEFVPHVVALIALTRVTEYNCTGNRLQGIVSSASGAKNSIRELMNDPYFDSAEGAVYY